ncbi:MAG: nucleotide-binding protein [Polyangiaceae bacterium]|nr:nucleotide-binding protein [Polyangiaceae bacterium]
MKSRFEGQDGRRRLLDALLEQRAVAHDQAIAQQIADAADIRVHQAGDVLMQQDDNGNDVAFLLAGRVDILVNAQRVASRMAGEHVGEMTAIDPKAKRSATVRASEETAAAWVTESKITEIAQQHPALWRGFARLLADRLRERGALVRTPNAQPRLFIGSSVEGLEIARIVQKELTHDPMVVTIWSNGVFGPSGVPVNDLLAESARSDFALFVLRGDDTTQSRGTDSPAPRDNVIFELGLFMGALGRERTLLLRPRGGNIKTPSDLLGITPLEYNVPVAPSDIEAALGPACQEIRTLVKRLGSR